MLQTSCIITETVNKRVSPYGHEAGPYVYLVIELREVENYKPAWRGRTAHVRAMLAIM